MPPLGGQKRACTGSIGEEQFVLQYIFGGSNGSSELLSGGTFLELGANDGLASNTIFLEQCLGWRGVLIEGQPETYKMLRRNRPRSLALGTAVCPQHGFVNFTQHAGSAVAGITSLMGGSHLRRWRIGAKAQVAVPCGPLGDWLKLLGVRHIDFFSLDVEGAELMVLNTIDWGALTVRVLLSECKAVGCTHAQDMAVSELLSLHGMSRAGVLRARHDIWDAVYVNSSLGPVLPFGVGAIDDPVPPKHKHRLDSPAFHKLDEASAPRRGAGPRRHRPNAQPA